MRLTDTHDSLLFATRTITSFPPATILITDQVLYCGGTGSRSITLPASANLVSGQRFVIRDISTAGGLLSLVAAGSDTIEGLTSVSVYDVMEVIWNGTEWIITIGNPIDTFLSPNGESPAAYQFLVTKGDTALQAANDAVLMRYIPSRSCMITKIAFPIGTTGAGNYDCGIYDSTGALLSSKGSTAVGGGSAEIVATLASPVRLRRGHVYWIAVALSSGADNLRGMTTVAYGPSRDALGTFLTRRVQTAFPLPNPITIGSTNALRYFAVMLRED